MRRRLLALTRMLAPALAIAASPLIASAAEPPGSRWMQPPEEILEVLHAPDLPWAWVDPGGTTLALLERLRYPPIAELAAPYERLAGVRVNPRTNSLHGETAFTSLTLRRIADGRERQVALPPDARILALQWSPEGDRLALAHRMADGVGLLLCDTDTGAVRAVPGMKLNPMLGSALQWMPDGRQLLVKRIAADRRAAPARPLRPEGPNVQESSGGRATSTYEARDVLRDAHDAALFEHHAASSLALVDAATLEITGLPVAGMIASADPSPDGSMILVERVKRPFSYRHAWWRFPRDVEVVDRAGSPVKLLASLPLADAVPIHGVPEGPRGHEWRPTEPATLTWVEALDGGDWSRKVPHRDRVMSQRAPFDGEPSVIHLAVHRLEGLSWGDTDDLVLVEEFERERRWRHGWALHPDTPSRKPVKYADVSENERYGDPGQPVTRSLHGHEAVVQDGDAIFMSGPGSTPSGDRPFLDRLSLATLKPERLFRSDADVFERFVDFVGGSPSRILTRRESPSEVPNYFELRLGARTAPKAPGEAARRVSRRAVTEFTDPTPILRGIGKRIVTFERKDGVPLSFTLFTPPGWKQGERLPTIVYAYPMEFSDPATAGQVGGTERSFTRLFGASHLFLLLSGYAILHDTTMPVIGDPDTAYDTFIEQLVSSAQAAVAKAVEMGVADPQRVGVMGHSHGGLMTATLLAHSDLFRAGIARSGAYNHTMRPFGFQSERRTLWEALDTYVRLSPVMHAKSIDEPILIIHGEADQNPGTVPLQSEKLYDAVRGTGGTARLLMLPSEMHGYSSREAVEHVLAEQLAWFDRWVKSPPPAESAQAAQTAGEDPPRH